MAETAAPARPVPVLPPPATATLREVFADGEFRALWLVQLAAIAGDQFARVALMVVFHRAGSPLLTALTSAGSYLPWLIGGLFLSGLADSCPRRDVMIAAPWAPLSRGGCLLPDAVNRQ